MERGFEADRRASEAWACIFDVDGENRGRDGSRDGDEYAVENVKDAEYEEEEEKSEKEEQEEGYVNP